MSLIITSSNQDAMDDASSATGLQAPYNYQNQFSSPLYIKPNSEIAVVSLKCNRTGFGVPKNCAFAVFWGNQPGSDLDTADPNYTLPAVWDINGSLTPDGTADEALPENRPLLTMGCSPNRPVWVTIPNGTYTQEQFADVLERQMKDVLKRTYEHVNNVAVDIQVSLGSATNYEAEDLFKGWYIRFTQSGDNGSGANSAEMNWTPYIDNDTMCCLNQVGLPLPEQVINNVTDRPGSYAEKLYTDKFTYTAAGGVSTIKKEVSASDTGDWDTKGTECEAIGVGHPLGLSDGVALFDISNGYQTNGGFIVGLTRNLVTNVPVKYKEVGSPEEKEFKYRKKDIPLAHRIDKGNVSPYGDPTGKTEFSPTFYDYGVAWINSEFYVFQSDAVGSGGEYISVNKVVPAFTPTNASLNAGYYDAIKFDVKGERVVCSIRQTSGGSFDDLIADSATTNGAKFKPVAMSNNLLFPKIFIAGDDDEIELTTWSGGTNGSTSEGQPQSYWDVRYYGASANPTGVDRDIESGIIGMEQIYRESEAVWLEADIDTQRIFQTTTGTDPLKTFYTPMLLNASDGIAYEWAILTQPSNTWAIGRAKQGAGGSILTGEKAMMMQNVRQLMGMSFGVYRENKILAANANVNVDIPSYEDGDGKDPTKPESATLTKVNDIVMFSQEQPKPISFDQMFVRVSSLAHNSFNGNKASISKILYGIPRWDARGNDAGGLYYEPHERVYVDLNYTSEDHVLNDLNIQIVNINEKEVTDLTGNTICVLHIRQKNKDSPSQSIAVAT
jgi:hypothetical protein